MKERLGSGIRAWVLFRGGDAQLPPNSGLTW